MRPKNAGESLENRRLFVQAHAGFAQKKRNEAEFREHEDVLGCLKEAASQGGCRLIYFDQAGWSASPPRQSSWSPKGSPHCAEPGAHLRRNVLGAFEHAAKKLFFEVAAANVDCKAVCDFLQKIAESSDGRPTFVVLDNASIHRAIPEEREREWLVEHKMILHFLPAYSPELNLIEVIWKQAKYHWRSFKNWSKETMREEIALTLAKGPLSAINFG